MTLETLTAEDVLRIHEILVADFAMSDDLIAPPGVRSIALLESAVGRQHVGHGSTLKYPDPISNAATLVYGVCNDHPFHNGNKRTALVAMLAHLDKNRLCLYDTSQAELYQLMLAIADHSLGVRVDPRRPDKRPTRRESDEEVDAIKDWLGRRVGKLKRGEKPITFRHLRQTLARFGFEIENNDANSVDVVRRETVAPSLFRRKPSTRTTRIGTIGYRNEGTEVSVKDLKRLRQMCKLTEGDGVDTDAFYSDAAVVDAFINRYRTVLRRLART
jgi:death-on-curing family protein